MSFDEDVHPGWPQVLTAESDHVAVHNALAKFGNKWAKPGAEGAGTTPPSDFLAPSEFVTKAELTAGTYDLNPFITVRTMVHPFYFQGSAESAESPWPIGIVAAQNCISVVAMCDPAPTGSDVTLQLSYNGDDVLNAPIAIVAGSAPRQQFESTDFAISQLAPSGAAVDVLYARIVDADSGDTAGQISCWLKYEWA
jgi:hypothetical protein